MELLLEAFATLSSLKRGTHRIQKAPDFVACRRRIGLAVDGDLHFGPSNTGDGHDRHRRQNRRWATRRRSVSVTRPAIWIGFPPLLSTRSRASVITSASPRGLSSMASSFITHPMGGSPKGPWPATAMLACAIVAISSCISTALAHPLAPSLIRIEEYAPGKANITWKTPKRRVPGSKLEPVLPDHCKPLSHVEVREQGAARIYTWRIDCGQRGFSNASIGADGIAESRTDVIVHLELLDGRTYRSILTQAAPRWSVPEAQNNWDVFTSYARLGFEHIISGFDHLSFVLGLMLLVSLRRLFWVVTAFTIGHSITLALSALNVVHVQQRPVEILIALSIGVLAWEIVRFAKAERTSFAALPVMMAATFGLLHGLGFAGALRELGLPQGAIPLSLFSFNAGIEVGQLAFIALALFPVALASSSESWSRPFRIASAYVIGSLAFYWVLERALA